jgi:CRP/FNR family transcriptional regulator, cyclic AMP receptor protein
LEPSRLKSIPLFQTVSDEELAEIAPFAEEVTVEAGTQLVREGDFSYEFMGIEEGQAEVSRGDERLAELGPGDFFGEIGVLERDLRTASVVAETDMRLIVLTGWDMKRMEKSMPQAVERVREVLEQRRPEG